ncbi:MAG: ArnT family glycosyltransferase [Planctomycetales bacterium]
MRLTTERLGWQGVDEAVAERPWWREWQAACLVLFVVVAFGSRLTELSIRGEESRRGLIAREMLSTGDWIIPRTQGVPLFSRPPLQNWIIAGLGWMRGDVDAFAIRFPSVCAILAMSLMIYRYGRRFLSPLGALAASLAFASMGQVLELGRTGETDALFTLFVSGALLAWHGGIQGGKSPYRTWCLGYALAALGTLTKGPQAPVYFVAPVGVYLLLTGRWRFAFSRAHLAGLATFFGVLAAWQIPCLFMVGVEGVVRMYVSDVGQRFTDANWFSFGAHLAEYPLELLLCLLPWSSLLIVWWNREFRRTLGTYRDPALFLAICLVVSFPTVWFPPGSRPRYFMSLYPCLALLVGLAIERVTAASRTQSWWVVWPLFVKIVSGCMLLLGLGFLAISIVTPELWLAQPMGTAVAYALVAACLAACAWRSVGSGHRQAPVMALLAIAGFVGISNATVILNGMSNATVDTEGAIADLKEQLPPDAKLVSFNVTHHLFTFHYRDDLPVVDWPENSETPAARVEYFCADAREFETKELPFPWKPVVEISCDRRKLREPRIRVVIGRRTDLVSDSKQSSPSPPQILAN